MLSFKKISNYSKRALEPSSRRQRPVINAPPPLCFEIKIGQVWHGDRAFYYKGPWTVTLRGRTVAQGEIMVYNKHQIASEVQRQLDFFCIELLD